MYSPSNLIFEINSSALNVPSLSLVVVEIFLFKNNWGELKLMFTATIFNPSPPADFGDFNFAKSSNAF